MIDHPRKLPLADDRAMHLPPSPDPTPPALDNFNTIRRMWSVSYPYGDYYDLPTYDTYAEPEVAASTNVYHNLVSDCEPRETWRFRYVNEWTEEDTTAWISDVIRNNGISEFDFPFYNFKIPGIALRGLKKEDIINRLHTYNTATCISLGEFLYDIIQMRLSEEMSNSVPSSTVQYPVEYNEPYQYQESQGLIDLDSVDNRNKSYAQEYNPDERQALQASSGDSSDNTEEYLRSSETASPDCSYKSDGTDDDSKNGKVFKRPPGRPRGSGRRNMTKRTRGPSVPEFLVGLLSDPDYCPLYMQWVDYANGKFRFNKPDAVAKLWGLNKQNPNMTFEKFSRAMRYHYKQQVLLPEPSARLVYRFGPKAPNYKTDNPNFANVKTENMATVKTENYGKADMFSNYKTASATA